MHQSIGLRGLTLDAGESATQVCPATEHSAHLRMASRFQNLEIFLLHSPRRLQCGKAARFLLNARSAHCFPESATETPSHCTNNISSTATDSTVVLPDARARGGGSFVLLLVGMRRVSVMHTLLGKGHSLVADCIIPKDTALWVLEVTSLTVLWHAPIPVRCCRDAL